jgi:hypothetical protein
VKLANVWVVEGGLGDPSPSVAAFDLRVEPTGWTLTDVDEPTIERLWSWAAIGGLEIVRGAGQTPDGRAATALDVIVNGWPVRILVPSQELPNETIAMLGAFAPVGHPLRASLRVTRVPALKRLSEVSRRYVAGRVRARPAFLLSAASTRLRSALVIGVVLLVTAVVASIAGVATSAQTTTTSDADAAQGTTAPHSSGPAPGGTSSSQASGTSSTPTSVRPAVAAGSASTAGVTTSTKAKSGARHPAKGGSATPTTPSKASTTTRPPSDTTNSVPATDSGPTTTAAPGSTTTTRPRRPPTTTTTRPRRPPTTTTRPPDTTTTPATTQPPPTTTAPPPTTTAPPPTTTQPSPTTTQAPVAMATLLFITITV